jgi:hypothetical protein
VVDIKAPVLGLYVSLVLDTFALEIEPLVALVNVKYRVAFVLVSSVIVRPPPVPLDADVTRPLASTVTVAFVYVAAVTPLLARVAVPVTLALPLKLPLVQLTSPVIPIVRPVVRVAALPLMLMPQVPDAFAPPVLGAPTVL